MAAQGQPMGLARKPDGPEQSIQAASGPFDLAAMNAMAELIPKLQKFMDENLEEGVNKDWEWSHVVFKKPPPSDLAERKSMLLDPGVGKIMNFMRCYPEHIWEVETDTKTNNLTMRMKVNVTPWLPIMYQNPLTNKMEPIKITIAQGVGSVTTREKKYKVRHEWMKHRDLLVDGWTKEDLEEWGAKHPEQFKRSDDPKYDNLYFMPTAESLGLDNNIFKMAAKRAEMDAVFQLPGVANRFSQENDLNPDRDVEDKPVSSPAPAAAPPAAKREEPKPAPPPTAKPVAEVPPAEKPKEKTLISPKAEERPKAVATPVKKTSLEQMQEESRHIINSISTTYMLSVDEVIEMVKAAKVRAAGLVTDEGAARIVANDLAESATEKSAPSGFKSATELPKVPDSFKLTFEAEDLAEAIVMEFNVHPDQVRAKIYEALQENKGISQVAAVKLVKDYYDRVSKPVEEPEEGEAELIAQLKEKGVNTDLLNITVDVIKPKKFLGDLWGPFNEVMKELGYDWVRDGRDSHWKRKP